MCEWGINDQGLFRIAKEEITNLVNSGQKFNFTMATIDCHTTDGIKCSLCPNTYSNRYENIYACQSKQVNNFISWCKEQSWFANTTIVLVGDHNTMARKLKITENEKHPLEDVKNDEITEKREE